MAISSLMAQYGMSQTNIYRAVVIAVDSVKHTCSIKGDMKGGQWSGVEIMPMYQTTEGYGSFYLPEVGAVVWACAPGDRDKPFIVGFAPSPSAEDQESPDEDPLDYRMNRPVLGPGDYMVASQDTAFIVLRKSGYLELGSGQTAKRAYIPLTNIIRDTFESYVMQGSGGDFSWATRREDESHGSDVTPVEYRLRIKEFIEEDPILDIAFGRIEGEDDFFVPPNGEIGQIIGRFILELPDGSRNFSAYLDRRGNVMYHTQGDIQENVEGTRSVYVRNTFQERVVGLRTSFVGVRKQQVGTDDALEVGRSRRMTVEGDVTDVIGGQYTKTVNGPTVESLGSVTQVIAGQFERTIVGNKNETVSGGKQTTVMENYHEVVGMAKTIMLGNAIPGGDAFKMVAANGNIQMTAPLGVFQLEALKVTMTSTNVQIGSVLATQPVVKGTQWTALWAALLLWMDTHTHMCTAPGTPSLPPLIPSSPILSPLQAAALSVKVFVE